MYRIPTLLFVLFCGILTSLTGQELLVTFASDINGKNEPGKYDLFVVKYDVQSNKAKDLKQLTDTRDATEFFPTLSEDKKWIAYNYQKDRRNEVRLIELESQKEFTIFENGRFPEWMGPNELLVTKVTRDEQDIYKLTLDLEGDNPEVVASERITDRTRCPETGKASDPFPVPNTGKVLFHALRPNQSGAALATIHLDGTGYRRLTDWNGSGHGISTADGSKVLCTRSQNGRPYALDVSDADVTPKLIELPKGSSELVRYDERYAQTPLVSYSYPAWGYDTHSVFYTLKGRSNASNIEVARLLYVVFDDKYESGQLIDFSTAVEALTASTGHNFSTASSRVIETPPVDTGVVYVVVFMHNEDFLSPNYPNYSRSESEYLKSREELLRFCGMMKDNGVPFTWESDWNFLLGVLKWDKGAVLNSTNGKSVVRYMKEDLGVAIDPHSHESLGYNYADVAKLIDSLGVTPNPIIGGYTWDPNHRQYSDWEQYRDTVHGKRFPDFKWKANILMGASGGGHDKDTPHSGVWRPKDKYHFWEDDPSKDLYAIGSYHFDPSIQQIRELVNLYSDGTIAPQCILTANKIAGQSRLSQGFTEDYERKVIRPLKEMEAAGEIKLVTFVQLIEDWKTIYNKKGHLYFPDNITANEEVKTSLKNADVMITPNPFSTFTTIELELDRPTEVRIDVLDASGHQVKQLMDEKLDAGHQSIQWDGTWTSGIPATDGMYYIVLKEGAQNRVLRTVKVGKG